MDFYAIRSRELKDGKIEIYPDFTVGRSKDLMVRGRSFYAIWDSEANLWSTDEYDVQRMVDQDLYAELDTLQKSQPGVYLVKNMRSFNSNSWKQFRQYLQNISDNSHILDNKLIFANTEVKKSDYASKRLNYPLAAGDYSAWDELVGTLYSIEERTKIEWAIGSIVSGDSKSLQKFLVLYGPAGTGKSTILNVIQSLFSGYTTTFEAKALGQNGNAFATEAFKNNPLVAIQHDGDLSRIDDNTKLNSIIAHEEMTMNEKYKPSYTSKVQALLFMGTNQPVKISDAKSGIIRRLIDVHPTGVRIPENHYNTLMTQIEFELGAIAQHCLEVYLGLGKNHYNTYRPLEMMLQTDVFFNFIEANFDVFKSQNSTSLDQAYGLYKTFCDETGIDRVLPKYKVREELRNYFDEFKERGELNGGSVRSYYEGFNANKFKAPAKESNTFSLVLDSTQSLFDEEFKSQPAQDAKDNGTPQKYWTPTERLINGVLKLPKPSQVVSTTLADIDTTKLHFVKVPENHIVIDFDLRGEDGQKSIERNLEAASVWPATYAELSQSGAGVHLHYTWDGDSSELASGYSDGIEVKVYRGESSLRRRLSRCNNVPIATINTGLPLKEKKLLHANTIQSEKGLRDLIARNLKKEIHPGTKPSIDFIAKILEDAYSSGMTYDVTDLRSKIMSFANNSTNQPLQSLKIVQSMKFASDQLINPPETPIVSDDRLVLYDVEVYPNLFVVCWKYEGSDEVVRMVNPSAQDVEALFKLKLTGFNNRRYDNHILYGRYMGYDNQRLFELSDRMINGNDRHAPFGEAYNLSYADIYDFSSVKQSLKKFQIELGIHHLELDFPWDEPVDEKDWDTVVEYCVNDVVSTEAVLNDRRQDLVARQILADLSGLPVNNTTQQHTAKIIFGDDKRPQKSFVYTDLSKEFPGYQFDRGKSIYKEARVNEGGYIYAETGYHEDVTVLDIASMHPTSIEQLKLFGPYTKNFSALKDARIAIKRGDYAAARKMLDGRLAPHLKREEDAKELSYALKIVINIVYGLTSAKFDNPFRDTRNVDNIVAKRGALFMVDLQEAVQEQGFTVAHIKTDSIKIPNATPKIIKFVHEFGNKYGYTFEHEATYDKFCLVNDAVYIAREGDKYTAVGAQFQHPYVFKTCFSNEEITFEDLCEAKSVVKGTMYLDMDNSEEFDITKLKFIGRTGLFVPVLEKTPGSGVLYRVNDDKRYAVAGTKGHFWMEADMAKALGKELQMDMSYFDNLAEEARLSIENFTGFGAFVR